MTGAVVINWANGIKQNLPIGVTAGAFNIGFVGGYTGLNGTLRINYQQTQVPGITGCRWPNSVRPTLSGNTGMNDIITVYCDGPNYYAQASLAFGVA
jgi:hypothetical protein